MRWDAIARGDGWRGSRHPVALSSRFHPHILQPRAGERRDSLLTTLDVHRDDDQRNPNLTMTRTRATRPCSNLSLFE